MRRPLLLYYTPYFKQTLCEAIGFAPTVAEDLCTVTLDRDLLAKADAVLFHIPDVHEEFPEKRYGQLWIGMSMESDANYPQQSDPEFMGNFDITMNFLRSADIQMLYFHPQHQLEAIKRPPGPKFRSAPAVYFASNGRALNGRFELVAELMKHMRVDSYGKSQNNRRLNQDHGRITKLEVISGYRFYLAFENSSCIDYVSEKVFDGFVAGTVPVYLGAPNIDEYLPASQCIINAADFKTPADLAGYLLHLCRDDSEYERFLDWKKNPLRASFLDLVEPEYTAPLRRLCYLLNELLAAYAFGAGRVGMQGEV